jgi:large subunit ribosomal protein L25
MNSIVMIEVGGKPVRTLPKDVALHPVTDRPLHVDFLRLARDAKIHVAIPVVFVNEEASPGLKKGGVLNVVRHELELVCESDKIPGEIQLDVTGLDVGDSIHISHVKLPEGSLSAITDRDFTIATIVAPSAMKQTEGEEGATVEAGAVPTAGEAEAEEAEGSEEATEE